MTGDRPPGRGKDRSLSFLAASWLMLCLIALEMVIGAAFHDFHTAFEYGDPRSVVVSVVTYGLLISALMHHQGTTYPELFGRLDPDAPSLPVIGVAVTMVLVGTVWWLSEVLDALERVLPDDPYALAMLDRLVNGGIVTVVAVCLVGPLIEEMLFRGIVLRGLLERYSTRTAIVLSALLFGLVHLNVYQVPAASVFGLFVGWLFVVYRSLWPCVFAHVLANAIALSSSAAGRDAIPDSLMLDVASLAVSALGIRIILETSRRKGRASSDGGDSQR